MHVRAFLAHPASYLQAVFWRLRGLRLRARHRFSALMGAQRGAYELWIATREESLHRAISVQPSNEILIDVVVDIRENPSGLGATLDSIGQVDPPFGGAVHVLGEDLGAGDISSACSILDLWPTLGRYSIFVGSGDLLSRSAAAAYRQAIAANPHAAMFYADDDLVDEFGRRSVPHFKPRWNPELARHLDFVSGSSLVVTDALPPGEMWRPLETSSLSPDPVHVPYVLHHRQNRPDPLVPSVAAQVSDEGVPHVSIVIPTRNQVALLRTCIEGVLDSDYPSFDVTVIDNGSDETETLAYLAQLKARGIRVVRDPGEFNYAAMHNRTVGSLAGPLLCFLNNDVEVIDRSWLRNLAAHAPRGDVGAVGALLLYPDRTVQHAGIVLGLGGGAGHAHRFQDAHATGYFQRVKLPQFASAVTAACLVVEKAKFEAVGGFDAETFAVAFNDVDLCLKLNERGWRSFYEPRAVLIHHESKSRGLDKRGAKKRRFAGELSALKQRWGTDVTVDPYHHPELSPFCEQFVVRL